MAETSMRPAQFGRLGVEGRTPSAPSFGNRGAFLGDALQSFVTAAGQTARTEADRAYRAGVRARLQGVTQDNANASNRTPFSRFFNSRAADGWDYQDAQYAAADIAMREQVALYEALRNGTSIDQFASWAQQQDAALAPQLEGRSDVYRTALAEQMMSHRESLGRTYAGWIIQNRERQAAAAARAGARAAAAAAEQRLELAAAGVAEVLGDGADPATAIREFTLSAPERFGITPEQAHSLAVEEVIASAGISMDHTLLDVLSPGDLTREQRAEYAQTRARIITWGNTVRDFEAEAASDAADAQAAALETEANRALYEAQREILVGGSTPATQAVRLSQLPFYQANPERLATDIGRLTTTQGVLADPAMDAMVEAEARRAIMDAAEAGDDPYVTAQMFLSRASTPGARAAIAEAAGQAEQAATDRMLVHLPQRRRSFDALEEPPGGSPASRATSGRAPAITARTGLAVEAEQDYIRTLQEANAQWHAENPGTPRMPGRTRDALEREVFTEIMDRYNTAATTIEQSAITEGTPLERLQDRLRRGQ